jgi:hypothetical protein
VDWLGKTQFKDDTYDYVRLTLKESNSVEANALTKRLARHQKSYFRQGDIVQHEWNMTVFDISGPIPSIIGNIPDLFIDQVFPAILDFDFIYAADKLKTTGIGFADLSTNRIVFNLTHFSEILTDFRESYQGTIAGGLSGNFFDIVNGQYTHQDLPARNPPLQRQWSAHAIALPPS